MQCVGRAASRLSEREPLKTSGRAPASPDLVMVSESLVRAPLLTSKGEPPMYRDALSSRLEGRRPKASSYWILLGVVNSTAIVACGSQKTASVTLAGPEEIPVAISVESRVVKTGTAMGTLRDSRPVEAYRIAPPNHGGAVQAMFAAGGCKEPSWPGSSCGKIEPFSTERRTRPRQALRTRFL